MVARRERGEQPRDRDFRFGPGDRSQPPWARDLPQNSFIWQTAGVGGSTVHYFANSPRAMPGALTYQELIPYYEWVEHTLPVQTAAMGTKEELFLRAATKVGLPTQTSKDISRAACRPQENAILPRAPPAARTTRSGSPIRTPEAARSAGTARKAAFCP